MRRSNVVLVLLAVALLHGVCDGVKTELCPQYIVQSGDTPESIAAATSLDLASLVAAIQTCGGAVDALTPGVAICLPGGEHPGCVHVRTFGDRPSCKFYATQAGDALSSVAVSLALFEPDLVGANPDRTAASLREGDLLKLPGWDDGKCGALPATLVELDSAPTPAPTPTPEPEAETPGPSPEAVPTPEETVVARGPGTAPKEDRSECRAFRVRDQDDLYTISALFAVNAIDIIAINPGLAVGMPLAGSILKIPPYTPACSYAVLIGAEEAAAAASGSAPAPAPAPAPSPTAAPPVRVKDAVALKAKEIPPAVEFAAISADLGGAENTVADQESSFRNIVKDGGNSNAPPPPATTGNGNSGAIIMASIVGAVVLAVLVLLVWAVANSKARIAAKTPGRTSDSDAASSVGSSGSGRTGSETYV